MKERSENVQQISACFIEPMLCLAVEKLPEGPAWQYEVKLDGYRAIAVWTKANVELSSQNKRDTPAVFGMSRALWRGCRSRRFEDRIFRVAQAPLAERKQPYG
jgi:ATP-dependent DNA ligase